MKLSVLLGTQLPPPPETVSSCRAGCMSSHLCFPSVLTVAEAECAVMKYLLQFIELY